jgi:hypothetical protein
LRIPAGAAPAVSATGEPVSPVTVTVVAACAAAGAPTAHTIAAPAMASSFIPAFIVLLSSRYPSEVRHPAG